MNESQFTDDQMVAVINVFGSAKQRKEMQDYIYLCDHFDEIVEKETQELLAKIKEVANDKV